MKKVARIVGLCSPPLQKRYMMATPEERATLRPVVEAESDWILNKMHSKGYRLEGTIADIYGVFLRGEAQGSLRLKQDAVTAT